MSSVTNVPARGDRTPAEDAGQLGYRVKIGGAERAVRESDVSAVATVS